MSQFQAGNLVVYGVLSTGSSAAAATVLYEYYTPGNAAGATPGSLAQTINFPTTTTGNQDELTDSSQATYSGEITETPTGAILAAGYDAPTTTASVSGTGVPRVIGVVSATGSIDTSTATTSFSGVRFTSAASADGQNFYVATGSGVGYLPTGSTAATILTNNVANQVEIVNNQLYYSTPGGNGVAAGIYSLGSGLPTGANQNSSLIVSSTKPVTFAFATLNQASVTPDTLYVADNTNGIEKFSLVNGAWQTTGPAVALKGVTGLAVTVTNGNATLYATTTANIQVLTDSSGYNQSLTGTPQVFATAPQGSSFKGDVVYQTSVCFCTGTLIRTARGDVPVELLAVGDHVVTRDECRKPVRWIGHRHLRCDLHPQVRKVWPVRVRAGAFGPDLPFADLWLSPNHALCLADTLVPVRALIDGERVAQVERAEVTYWHVEVDGHDVLLANGLPAESYLNTGNRSFFGRGAVTGLHFDEDPAPGWNGTGTCLPLVESGPRLSAIRTLYGLARNDTGSLADSAQAGVHLVVDGTVVQPCLSDDKSLRFLLPAGASDLRLVSPSFHVAGDRRRLGVLVSRLAVSDGAGWREIALDHPGLYAGFHDREGRGDRSWRWTDGNGHLASSLFAGLDGPVILRLTGQFAAAAGTQGDEVTRSQRAA